MARSLRPLVRGGGYYPSNRWTPLVYAGGYTTANGGGEPEPPPIEKTVIGNPIHITDALAKPVQALSIALEPIQDLHGYDNPWPSGGGSNIVDVFQTARFNSTLSQDGLTLTSAVATATGNYNFAGAFTKNHFHVSAGEKMYVSFDVKLISGTCQLLNFQLTNNSVAVAAVKYGVIPTAAGERITAETTLTSSYTEADIYGLYCQGRELSNCQIQVSNFKISKTADYVWTPFSNICPIYGHTDADVTRTGKNLLNKANVLQNLFINTSQQKIGSIGATGACVYCAIKGGEKYTVSKMASARFTIATTTELPALSVAINNHVGNNTATSLTIQTTEEDNYIVAFVFLENADTGKTQQEILDTVQCELGSTASSYSPYVGTTYPIPLGQTVYGGTLDVVTGVLTVDRVGFVSTSDNLNGLEENTSASTNDWLVVRKTGAFPDTDGNKRADSICSHNKYKFANVDGTTHYYITTNGFWMALPKSAYPTFTDFTSTLTGNNILTCVAYIATPTTVQLTAQQVELLLGENNLFSDGTMTLVYLADGNASDVEALNILLGGRYVNNHGEDEPTDREALDIILGGNER